MPVQYYNGQLYNLPETNYPGPSSWMFNRVSSAPIADIISANNLKPINVSPQAPAPTPAPQMNQLQPQFNRLTGQARNALYGGLLGYQAPALTSGGSNPQSFAAPQGGFRFPFGLLNQG